jgi:hypothetical protein
VVRRDGRADGEVGRDVVARQEGEGRGGQDGADERGQTGGWLDGIGTLLDGGGRGVCQMGGGRGVARRDRVECRTGICGGRMGWEGIRTGRTQGTAGEGVLTKGKGETSSLDHVRMRYVGSSGASSPSSSVESSVLSSCSGNPLRRCKTSFLMTILLVR